MSASPPWMPLNVGDYLKDTAHLAAHEHGAYLLLIMRYWQDGGLPAEETLIRRYSLLTAEQWVESRPVLAALFDEGWKHKRIDVELAKAAEIIEKRRSAASQRHSKSNAHAEQMESTSPYAGVPHSQLQEPEDKPPAPVQEPVEARALFDEIWEAFPRNPTSSEAKAEAAFSATKASEHPKLLAAALRFRQWFAEDNAERKRTVDAGLRYAPHLATWISSGEWRKADALPVKADAVGPPVSMTQLDRDRDHDLWLACERVMGKPAPTSNMTWWFKNEVLEQARAAA